MIPRWWHGIVAAVAVGVVFLWPVSPALSARDASAIRLYTALIVIVVCAIIVTSPRMPSGAWTVVMLASAGTGVALLLTHLNAAASCIAEYDGRVVVIGRTLAPNAIDYVARNPGSSASDLLFDAAGDPARVWTSASIRSCHLWLGWGALASVPLFAAAVCASIARRRYWSGAAPLRAAPVARASATPVYDAFISYRHTEPDTSQALAVVEELETRGQRVAIDFRDFRPNEHFLAEMERCIKESRFTLCIITPNYLNSDHCEEEAIICKTLDLADRRKRLVPLIFERVPLPVWLHGLVGIDFTADAPIDPNERLQALVKRSAESSHSS
jgi:hypothetical protein